MDCSHPASDSLPQFDTNVYVTNRSYSSYNSLLATLHKKMSNGLQFDLNYTYSHSIDDVTKLSANSFFTDFVCDLTNLKVCKGELPTRRSPLHQHDRTL